MNVSTVAELIAAVDSSGVDKILVAAGTYNLTTRMCMNFAGFLPYERSYSYEDRISGEAFTDGAAICINRAVTIEAQVPGSVVLNVVHGDSNQRLRVFFVDSGGTARLIGLNITGGYAAVRSVALLNPCALELTGCCARAHGIAV